MSGVKHKKPIQLKFSRDNRRDKSKIERSVDRAGTSGKSGPSVLLLTDSSVRRARVPHNNDDILLQDGRRYLPLRNLQPNNARQLLIILQRNNSLVRLNGMILDCGIFVTLYALYILREGRESIPHTFDASKCRMNICHTVVQASRDVREEGEVTYTGEGDYHSIKED
ncbi:uncharacterized protein LOC111406957 [Olea europaea var. sylvestris]|uniref:uncharacterized protein LOC111406957 n=1 Tax=Olea europaea var. sylvestris TaxID=158386 RepID=UPI000C1D6B27|nr:uncharacterized protein LOC111406957 [Olea europaea var. sylvestris]